MKYANYKEFIIPEGPSSFKITLPNIFTLSLSTCSQENESDIK
jgi:hypothetical protein